MLIPTYGSVDFEPIIFDSCYILKIQLEDYG